MIDPDQRPDSIQHPLLKSASTPQIGIHLLQNFGCNLGDNFSLIYIVKQPSNYLVQIYQTVHIMYKSI